MNTTRDTGIPTAFAGYHFRSRLEARWACFFTRIGWQWEYEPFDMDGWIPDFALIGRGASRPVLVEVKPIIAFDEDVARKLDAADQEHEVLLLGLTPILQSKEPGEGHIPFGWLRETWREDGQALTSWGEAAFRCWGGKRHGFCHSYQSYRDRMTGDYDGSCPGGGDEERAFIRNLWSQSANETQWRRPR